MKGAILFCALFAAVFISTTTADQSGYIRVINNGGYVAFFSVDYTVNGNRVHKETGDFYLGVTKSIAIPAGAKDVYVKAGFYWFFSNKAEIFAHNYPSAVTKCFRVYGTNTDPHYDEIDC